MLSYLTVLRLGAIAAAMCILSNPEQLRSEFQIVLLSFCRHPNASGIRGIV
jgi:hypothetical protein